MPNARDFQSILTEYLACSRRPGKAWERSLGVRKNGGVTLYGVSAPLLSVGEILAIEPQEFRRKYRGEVGVPARVDPACPHCGRLSCCGDIVRNRCTWCAVVGTAEIQPERPVRRTPGNVVRTAWIAFHEWVYDLMTSKNRPKTMREAEETYRKLKRP